MDTSHKVKKNHNCSAYIVLIIAAALSYYIYYAYQKNIDTQINIDYFRQLSEAEDSLNMQLSRIKSLKKRADEQAIRSQYNSYKEDIDGRVCEKSFISKSISKPSSITPVQQEHHFFYSNGRINFNYDPNNQPDSISKTNSENGVKVLINIGVDGQLCIQRSVKESKKYSYIKLNEILSQLDINFDDILLANNENKILGNANSYGVHNIVQLSNLIKKQQQQENQQTSSLSAMLSKNVQQIDQGTDSIQQTSFTDTLLGGQDSRILFHPVRLTSNFAGSSYLLVATLQHSQLKTRDPIEHNLPYLITGISVLVAIWVITLLWFYKINKSLPKSLRKVSTCVLYSLLISCVCFTLIQSARLRLIEQREIQTNELLKTLDTELTHQLIVAVKKLLNHKAFYDNRGKLFGMLSNRSSAPFRFPVAQCSIKPPVDELFRESTFLENTVPIYNPNILKIEDIDLYKYVVGDWIEMYLKRSRDTSVSLIGKNIETLQSKIEDGDNPELVSSSSSQLSYNEVKLISSFTTKNDGKVLISTINSEKPLYGDNVNLSHRDYFKEIQRGNGWRFYGIDNQLYLQRLHNIADGSLGTTISTNAQELGQVIGGDIFLPSTFNLNSQVNTNSKISDASIMLVNQYTGEVLYHSDNNRSLKENLLTLNSAKTQTFSSWLTGNDHQPLAGYYHGRSGYYLQHKFAESIDKNIHKYSNPFTLVAFLPSTNVNSFATNHYIYLLVIIIILLLGTLLLAGIIKLFALVFTGELFSGIAPNLKKRIIVKLGSRLINRCNSIGTKLTILVSGEWRLYLIQLPVLTSLILLTLVETFYQLEWFIGFSLLPVTAFFIKWCLSLAVKHRGVKSAHNPLESDLASPISVTSFVLTSILFITIVLPSYLSSEDIFQSHQENLAKFNEQQNRTELLSFFREYYPNSLAYCISSDNCDWLTKLREQSNIVEGDLTTYTRLNLYKKYLSEVLDSALDQFGSNSFSPDRTKNFWSILLLLLCLALIGGWLVFYIAWARPRLHLSYDMKRYLEKLKMVNEHAAKYESEKRKLSPHGLILQLGLTKRDEGHLASSLRTSQNFPYKEIAKQLSDWNTPFEEMLPNLKADYKAANDTFELWDMEICLEIHRNRKYLLSLIEYLKDLNHTHQLTVVLHCSSSTFHKLKWHNELLTEQLAQQENQDDIVGHHDMLAWSECLMDFNLMLDASIDNYYQGLDIKLAEKEQKSLPELAALDIKKEKFKDTRLDNSTAHTYSYLLHCFEATYRYKWENCNDKEKLALYYLTQGKQINPQNKHLVSLLGQKGLITLDPNKIDLMLVNNTFKIFVRNAESQKVFEALIRRAEAGTWKNFRLPFTLLILMGVAGLAFTSGQSIFILLGGVSAALSSIASIRSNFGVMK